MDERTFRTLELDRLTELLAPHSQSPLGRKLALQLVPSSSRAKIDRALDRTTECADYLCGGSGFGLSGLEDPEAAMSRLQVQEASLEPGQILVIERVIGAGMGLRTSFVDAKTRSRFPELSALTSRIPDLRQLQELLRGKILPTGEIADSASAELRRIRREIDSARTRIQRSLESILRDQSSAVQEDIITIRNGRFVIPVRTEARRQVSGVMHGLSSSGQTTFLEPLAVIDQNNELVRLREEEEIEIARILSELSESLRADLPQLQAVVDVLAELDFAQAKARLSKAFRCVRPQMHDGRKLRLLEARHLLLEKALKDSGAPVVPISFELDDEHQVMVISGPNAGGKTVVLKTTGLIALMAQMGLHVPAVEAELPVFDQIFSDIGDQQSISANLSTFTAHIRNISEMVQRIAPPALVLIDEVGTGTDPHEGAALAVAIVDYFYRLGATTIATTHYNELKMWAAQKEGVINASVEFDERTLRPTFRLLVGIAGASAGIEIARRMNLPPAILEEAIARVDPAQMQAGEYLKQLKAAVSEQESLVAALEEERKVTAEKYARLDLEFARRQAEERSRTEAALDDLLRDFAAESDRWIKTVEDQALAARLKKQAQTQSTQMRRSAEARLKKQVPSAVSAKKDKSLAPDPEPAARGTEDAVIREGDRVFASAWDKEGTVESIKDEVYTVLLGSLRLRLKADELRLVGRAGQAQGGAEPASTRSALGMNIDRDFAPELKVIGMTADEAADRVDKFLDEAFLADAESVRIIHGHGKGVLRRVISTLLKANPNVDSFNPAAYNQGGAGVTVVTLKK